MSDPHKRVGFTRRKLRLTVEFLQERLAEAETSPERAVEFYWYFPMDEEYQPPKHPSVASSS